MYDKAIEKADKTYSKLMHNLFWYTILFITVIATTATVM